MIRIKAGDFMARPLKQIDRKQFENLCALQCTEEEICGWFDCCTDTLDSWCKRTYVNENNESMGFSEVFKQKRGKGKISLRRAQWRLAEKNANMAIFLGKNYLGQTDQMSANINMDIKPDALSESLEELGKSLKSD